MPFTPLLTPEQAAWVARRRAQAARANAAMPEIIAEMRAAGMLKPLKPAGPSVPLFKRSSLDADYWDNADTIEAGE